MHAPFTFCGGAPRVPASSLDKSALGKGWGAWGEGEPLPRRRRGSPSPQKQAVNSVDRPKNSPPRDRSRRAGPPECRPKPTSFRQAGALRAASPAGNAPSWRSLSLSLSDKDRMGTSDRWGDMFAPEQGRTLQYKFPFAACIYLLRRIDKGGPRARGKWPGRGPACAGAQASSCGESGRETRAWRRVRVQRRAAQRTEPLSIGKPVVLRVTKTSCP